MPEEIWRSILERAERNLRRLGDIEGKVQDIMRGKESPQKDVISGLLDRCADLLETIASEELGENPLVEKIRNRIDCYSHRWGASLKSLTWASLFFEGSRS